MLGDCQLLTSVIIGASVSSVVGVPLDTVVWGIMERVVLSLSVCCLRVFSTQVLVSDLSLESEGQQVFSVI